MFTFLRSIRQLNQPLTHLRQQTLVWGTMVALLLALGGELLPTIHRVDAAPRLQESPLSPLTPANATTPITVTDTGTNALTGTTGMTAGAPLPSTAVTHTESASVEPTPVGPTSAEASSPLPTATVPAELTALAGQPLATVRLLLTTLLASGQISLVLVAALFVGLFTVIGIVLGRRPQ